MYHIIMNPTASSGKGAKVWKKVQKILQEENVAYEQYQTSSVMDTKNIVRRLTANADSKHPVHLIVLGGDGTLNTVLNGIEQFEYTTLSCIRTGSGNDFARNVGISKNVSRAMDGILHHPKDICLDYGIAAYKGDGIEGKRRFLISSGMGYDADICEEVSRSRLKRILNRIHLGKLVYVAIGIKQIFTRRSLKAVIVVDKETPINVKRLFFCRYDPSDGGWRGSVLPGGKSAGSYVRCMSCKGNAKDKIVVGCYACLHETTLSVFCNYTTSMSGDHHYFGRTTVVSYRWRNTGSDTVFTSAM